MGILQNDPDDRTGPAGRLRAAAEYGGDRLVAEFMAATVYVERAESGTGPRIQLERDGRRWVDAYSMSAWVPGMDVGQEVDIATMTGRHLRGIVPPGVGIRLDPGHPHARDIVTAATDQTPSPAVIPGASSVPVRELVREARAVHVGTSSQQRVVAVLRRSHVYLGRLPDGVPVATLPQRGRWVCVFSSVELLLAAWGSEVPYMLLSGRDLVDVLLPGLAGAADPIGVFLDLGTDHQLSLPAKLITSTEASDTGSAAGSTGPAPRAARRWWRQR